MRREIPGFVGPLVMVCLLGPSAGVLAQTTMDPTRAEFNPSADHDTLAADGSALVTSYRLDLFLSGATQPFQSTSLGKPNPDPDGIIRVDLASTFVGWPIAGTVYTADVAAVGPGGSAASAMSNLFAFSGPCAFTAAPAAQTIGVAGGAGTVTVTTAAGCSWTASSNASWITITAGASGAGSGAVTFAATSNGGPAARTGTLTVAGQTATVTQNGSCTYSVTPASQAYAAAGGAGSVTITAPSGCAWNATSGASWITITSGSSGSGNGIVNYTVAANTGTAARSGTLTAAGQPVTITESAPCSFAVSPTSLALTAAGGSGSATVTTPGNCNWTATSNVSWITVASGASGSGNGTVSFRAAANTGTASRSGTLTVAGRTVTVTEGAPTTTAPRAPSNVRIVGSGAS